MCIAMTSQDAPKCKIYGKSAASLLDFAINSTIAEYCQMLTEQSRFRERAARISTTHLYLSLSDCSSTRIFKRTHTYRNIWTTANQRGGPPFTISDWFRPRYEPNLSVVEQQRDFLSRGDFSFFLEWLDAPVRPQIFFSRTLEKFGCTLSPASPVRLIP